MSHTFLIVLVARNMYELGFGIILGFVLDGVIHSLIRSLPLAENI
jgi:hypothetical protein